MIYLASPYSHPDPAIREFRYQATLRMTVFQMQLGKVVFSPIVYGHVFATGGFTKFDHLSWKTFNDEMMAGCDTILVLRLDGWKESAGIAYETKLARAAGMAYKEIDPL